METKINAIEKTETKISLMAINEIKPENESKFFQQVLTLEKNLSNYNLLFNAGLYRLTEYLKEKDQINSTAEIVKKYKVQYFEKLGLQDRQIFNRINAGEIAEFQLTYNVTSIETTEIAKIAPMISRLKLTPDEIKNVLEYIQHNSKKKITYDPKNYALDLKKNNLLSAREKIEKGAGENYLTPEQEADFRKINSGLRKLEETKKSINKKAPEKKELTKNEKLLKFISDNSISIEDIGKTIFPEYKITAADKKRFITITCL